MKLTKLLKTIGKGLLSLFIILSILPYCIPLSKAKEVKLQKPYVNSEFFTTSQGIDLHYRVFKPALEESQITGKILLVHGMGGSTYSFEKTAPALTDAGFLVVVVDLPGFGYSDRSTTVNHSQASRANALWELLDFMDNNVLDNEKPPTTAASSTTQNDATEDTPLLKWQFAGHSMGGGTVAAMSVERPDQVASLILIDGALLDMKPTPLVLHYPPVTRWLEVLLEHVFIQKNKISSFLASAYGQTPSEADLIGYLEPLQVAGTARGAGNLLKTSKNMPLKKLSVVGDLNIPVLAIWGEQDDWVPISDSQEIKKYLPQMQIEMIPSTKHCPMETAPEAFNQVLMEFVTSID